MADNRRRQQDAEASTSEVAEARQESNPYSKMSRSGRHNGLTRSQKILGALVASIALTFAVMVIINPTMYYSGGEYEDSSDFPELVTDKATRTSVPQANAHAATGSSNDTEGSAATGKSQDTGQGEKPSSSSGTSSGSSSGGNGSSSSPSVSKSYGVSSGGGSGSSGNGGTSDVTVPNYSSSIRMTPETPSSPQLSGGQRVSTGQRDIDAMSGDTYVAPTTPTEGDIPISDSSDRQETRDSSSDGDEQVTPPEIRADRVELTLEAKHSHGSYHAHDDMNINEWQDGYYVLHRNAPAGDDIFALKPGDIIHIDGMDCTVEQSIDISSDEYFEDIRDMAGWDTVIFHTCHRPASSGLSRIIVCRPSVNRVFGVWHNGELIDAHTWMSRL